MSESVDQLQPAASERAPKRRWPLFAGIGAGVVIIAVVAAFVGVRAVQDAEVRASGSADAASAVGAHGAAKSASDALQAELLAATDTLSTTLDPLLAIVKSNAAGFPAALVDVAFEARDALAQFTEELADAAGGVDPVTLGVTGVTFTASVDELGDALGNAYLQLGAELREGERAALRAEVDRLGALATRLEADGAPIADLVTTSQAELRAVLTAASEMLPRMLDWRAAADESIKANLSAVGTSLSEAAATPETDFATLHALAEEYVAAIAAATASDRANSSGTVEVDWCGMPVCGAIPWVG
jgi:hypothetical protein